MNEENPIEKSNVQFQVPINLVCFSFLPSLLSSFLFYLLFNLHFILYHFLLISLTFFLFILWPILLHSSWGWAAEGFTGKWMPRTEKLFLRSKGCHCFSFGKLSSFRKNQVLVFQSSSWPPWSPGRVLMMGQTAQNLTAAAKSLSVLSSQKLPEELFSYIWASAGAWTSH